LATTDYSLAHSLPANVEAERSILGAILLDNFAYNQAAEHLKPEDFSLDSHRRIYTRMMDLAESSRPIDMITLVEEFDRHKELEAIGDVGYISGLVDGVPDRPSIEHYIKIVRDKALMRGLIHVSNSAIARAADQSDPAEEVLNDAEAAIMQLSEKRIGRGFWACRNRQESFGSSMPAATRPAHHRAGHALPSRRNTSGLALRLVIIPPGPPWERQHSP
jgi:replicative DNA helicase